MTEDQEAEHELIGELLQNAIDQHIEIEELITRNAQLETDLQKLKAEAAETKLGLEIMGTMTQEQM